MKSARQKTVKFLNSIGIRTIRGKVPVTSFLPGIHIRRGAIFYNQRAIAADLLHEAAHIVRQVIQASEAEAIAWSWAAGRYIGLLDEEIITNDPRHFNGEGSEIRE